MNGHWTVVLALVLVATVFTFSISMSPVFAFPAPAHSHILSDTTLTKDHNGVIIIDADGVTLDCAGFSVIGSGSPPDNGINIFSRSGVTVKNCNVSNFGIGFALSSSSNNILEGNTAESNLFSGFSIGLSSDNILRGNTATNQNVGFALSFSTGNTFQGNTASSNIIGFRVGFSSGDNSFLENTVSSNSFIGFRVDGSSTGNTIFHNNIIANTRQASDSNPAANNWHDPVLLEGNFWSDYAGVDDGSGAGKHAIAGDGIGDTRIPHPSANFDNFPFIEESGWDVPEPEGKNNPCDALEKAENNGKGEKKGLERAKANNDC